MALKTWTKSSFPYRNLRDSADQWTLSDNKVSLVVDGEDLWTKSESGVEEYYYTGDNVPGVPGKVFEDESEMTKGEIGDLAEGEWDYGDNDDLGNSTIYVRLSDSSDPDDKSDNYLESLNGEYYFNETIDEEPSYVIIDGEIATKGTLGELAEGEWAWDDVDSIGSNALYVKISEGKDPDEEDDGYVKSSYKQDLIDSDTNLVLSLSFLISNYSIEKNANIMIYRTDSDDNVLFKWGLTIEAGDSPFALDSKLVFNDGQKLKLESDIEEVSAEVNGDEQ
ncbi:MAG: hypothetical protein ACOC40_02545 [Thermoplasmatota archaeon]